MAAHLAHLASQDWPSFEAGAPLQRSGTVTGKERRIGRLLHTDGKTLLVAVDHSVTTGQAGGLTDMGIVLGQIVEGGADAVIAHRGSATRAMPVQREAGLVIHLSGGTTLSERHPRRELVCDPETALSLGADAVSLQITLGMPDNSDFKALTDLGRVASECDRLGLPLLVMAYALSSERQGGRATLHAARVAAELGADIVKTEDPGPDLLPELVASVMAPVVLAGGEVTGPWDSFLRDTRYAMRSGVAGFCIGRRVFGHKDPTAATKQIYEIVHDAKYNRMHRTSRHASIARGVD